MSEPSPALELHGLRRAYRAERRSVRVALNDVSLTLDRGRWLALLGPNGSGKSTLMRIVATLDAPERGEARIFGIDALAEPMRVRERLAVVFQQPGLDGLLSVRENLLAQAALHGLRQEAARERVETVARELGVQDRLRDRVDRLSGGLVRRVDLARALVSQPSLLLLDEPTGGLDHDARIAFLDTLDRLRAEHSMTIVMSTHLMDEAERADVVALLHGGRLAAMDTPDALRLRLSEGDADQAETLLRCEGMFASTLRAHGLHVTQASGRAVGAGDAESVERAAAALLRHRAAFEIGPPTLGDVYMALTGARLDGEAAEGLEPSAQPARADGAAAEQAPLSAAQTAHAGPDAAGGREGEA